mmetsp:Transcript_40740/g.49592  ORF Transcript_40740/g.49592 Transcript_40740/m.49592 type:complete len:266 (+) Transcript_40740:178-975(+)
MPAVVTTEVDAVAIDVRGEEVEVEEELVLPRRRPLVRHPVGTGAIITMRVVTVPGVVAVGNSKLLHRWHRPRRFLGINHRRRPVALPRKRTIRNSSSNHYRFRGARTAVGTRNLRDSRPSAAILTLAHLPRCRKRKDRRPSNYHTSRSLSVKSPTWINTVPKHKWPICSVCSAPTPLPSPSTKPPSLNALHPLPRSPPRLRPPQQRTPLSHPTPPHPPFPPPNPQSLTPPPSSSTSHPPAAPAGVASSRARPTSPSTPLPRPHHL